MEVVDASASQLLSVPVPPRSTRAGMDRVAFEKMVSSLQELFAGADPLDAVPCDPAFKAEVVKDARVFLGASRGLQDRHLLWMRRLAPVVRLPRGLPIVDRGGGYGLDALALAVCGHDVILHEARLSALAVFGFLADHLSRTVAPLSTRSVLADKAEEPPLGPVQAILLHEGARGRLDDAALLAACHAALPVNGQLFLSDRKVGFPRTKGLRARTWRALAEQAGFLFMREHYHCAARSRWREMAEVMPGLRHLAASHVTLHFAK